MKFKITTLLILHFSLLANLSAYEIVIDKSSSNKEMKFIDNILYPNKTKYETQSSSNGYYYYPKSEQDCYSRGMKPFNAANGSLICGK